MKSGMRTTRSFRSGFVVTRERVRLITQYDALRDMGEPDSFILEWSGRDGKWQRGQHVEWTAIRLWVFTKPTFKSFTLGAFGEVAIEDDSGNVVEEVIDPTLQGPKGSGILRDLRGIGDELYACGMSRRVYCRDGGGTWRAVDAGTAQAPDDPAVRGFNAIDGLHSADLYAVGFEGEIWRREQGAWRIVGGPTNVILHRVLVAAEDLVFVCGQLGMILYGAGDRWTLIEQDQTEDNFWGMALFQDIVWLATDSALFRLLPDRTLERVDTGLGEEWTYRHLYAADGVLWSFGQLDVAWTADGRIWQPATP